MQCYFPDRVVHLFIQAAFSEQDLPINRSQTNSFRQERWCAPCLPTDTDPSGEHWVLP